MGVSRGETEYGARNPPGSRVNLKTIVLGFVALAAVAGWAASFIGLHDFGVKRMVGFDPRTAWLIPAAFDGAAFACAALTYRASIAGRSAVRGRLLTWAFTALSSWINYIHQPASTEARLVAVWLPIAAVAVFDVVLSEMRADWEEAHGRKAFRMRIWLLALRAIVDREGTRAAFRTQITDIPVSSLVGLGADLRPRAVEAVEVAPAPAEPVQALAVEAVAPVEVTEPEVVDAAPEPANDVSTDAPQRPDREGTAGERPEWLTDELAGHAKRAMFAYLDLHPTADGAELDTFGIVHLGTRKDYGRKVRRDWVKARQAQPANEG